MTDVDQENFDPQLLHRAIADKQQPAQTILDLMFKFPWSVYQLNTKWEYPLHGALRRDGFDRVIENLIKLHPGALRHMNKKGDYQLHLACVLSQSDHVVIEVIQAFPAAVNETDKASNYPLRLAYQNKHLEQTVLKLIKDFPMVVEHKNKQGWYPFSLLNCEMNDATMKLIDIFQHAVSQDHCKGGLPLHAAIVEDQSEQVVLKLIAVYPIAVRLLVGIKGTVEDKQYALQLACRFNQSVSVIRKMVELFPEALDQTDNREQYPIHTAILQRSSFEVVRYLIEADHLSLQRQDQVGLSSLHYACYIEDLPLVGYMVRLQDVAINTKDDYGDTALHLACDNGSAEIVVMLLQHKSIDVNARNKKYETPLHSTLRELDADDTKCRLRIVKLLTEHSCIPIDLKSQENAALIKKANKHVVALRKECLQSPNDSQLASQLEDSIQILELLEKIPKQQRTQMYEYYHKWVSTTDNR
jgi:ankyrin repeat protein